MSDYIAIGHFNSPSFTLLDHSSGSVSLASTYTLPGTGRGVSFSNIIPPEGATFKVKISGTFEEKPLMIKKDGTFEQVSAMQVGGWT